MLSQDIDSLVFPECREGHRPALLHLAHGSSPGNDQPRGIAEVEDPSGMRCRDFADRVTDDDVRFNANVDEPAGKCSLYGEESGLSILGEPESRLAVWIPHEVCQRLGVARGVHVF
jgi:hypothetical protein